VPLIK